MTRGYIFHVDGDAFFAQCEIARYPHLRGRPVVVGQERGIATAFTYEAKALGIVRGMPLWKVKKYYPEVIILPSHFELYKEYSKRLIAIVSRYLDQVESYSIDECFGFARGDRFASWDEVKVFTQKIKQNLQNELGITFSFGVARTKVLAKVASKLQKPNGCTILRDEYVNDVLSKLSIDAVWGIGRSTAFQLRLDRITNALEFIQTPKAIIEKKYAKPVVALWYELSGIQIFSLERQTRIPSSLQSTKSFMSLENNYETIVAHILKNLEIVCGRARKNNVVTNTVVIELKTKTFEYHTKEITLPFFTNNDLSVVPFLEKNIRECFQNGVRYRSTGVTLLSLMPSDRVTYDLFNVQKNHFSINKIGTTIDQITKKFGRGSIVSLGSLALYKTNKSKKTFNNKVEKLPFPFLGEVI